MVIVPRQRTAYSLGFLVALVLIAAAPSPSAADTPVIPDSWRTTTWHYPVIKRPLTTTELSATVTEPAEAPVMRLAGGEYELAVFGIHPASPAASATPLPREIIVDLRDAPSGYTVAVSYLPPFTVDRKSRWFDSSSVKGDWFDPIVPLPTRSDDGVLRVDTSAIGHARPHYFLFELRAPRGGSRRDFTVRVHARTDAGVRALPPLTVEPFAFDLPKEHALPLLAGVVPEDVFDLHRTYGLLPEEEAGLWLTYLAVLREHRIVPYDPTPEKNFNRESFESIALPLYRGELTPDGVPAPAIRFPENPYPRGSAERVQFYRTVADRLREEGLLERAIYYVDDEPLMGDYTQLLADAEEIHATVPELRRLVTESYNPPLAGAVDIWCPDIAMLDVPVPFFPMFGKGSGLHPDFQVNPDVSVYATERDAGRELWLYTCTSAQYADLPNLFIDAEPIAARVIPWVLHQTGATGMVYYRVTQAYKKGNDPWQNQHFFSANGDGTLVYPAVPDHPWGTEHGALPSLRMKILRDGLEDYEYLALLERNGGSLADLGADTVSQRSDLVALMALRSHIGTAISEANAPPRREVERFHHVSQPGVVTDLWYISAAASPSGGSAALVIPSYRHYLASVLDTGRNSSTVATRGRWQTYLQIGALVDVDGTSFTRGGYSAAGWTVSPETARRLNRNWLIPYVGLEGGVITGSDGSSTHTGFAGSVLAGLHIWSTPRTALTIGTAWTHTTTDQIPVAFRATLAFDFVLDAR